MKTRTVILTAVGLIVGATAFAAGEPPPAWTTRGHLPSNCNLQLPLHLRDQIAHQLLQHVPKHRLF